MRENVRRLPVAAVASIGAEELRQHSEGDEEDGESQELDQFHHHVTTVPRTD